MIRRLTTLGTLAFVSVSLILALTLTTTMQQQEAYAQIESNGDAQEISGDDTITQADEVTTEITQSADVDCDSSGDGDVNCNVSQESNSGGSPITHGPINTSRSNIKTLN